MIKTKASRQASAVVEIPQGLDVPEFREKWQEFLGYRREIRKPLRAASQGALLKRLCDWGAAAAIESIDSTISNGWQGLFQLNGESKNGRNGKTNGRTIGPGQRHPQDAAERSRIGTF